MSHRINHIDSIPIDKIAHNHHWNRSISTAKVEQFRDLLLSGHVFSPIEVVRVADRYRAVTGCHRIAAHIAAGRTTIDAIIVDF